MPVKVYTQAEVAQIAATYAATGNVNEVSRQLNVPSTTIKDMRKNPQFIEYYNLALSEHREQIQAGLQQIMTKALNNISDGLTNGDEIVSFGSEGEVRRTRRMPSTKDTAITFAIVTDKLQLLSGKAINTSQGEDRLEMLAKRLEDVAQSITGEAKPVSG